MNPIAVRSVPPIFVLAMFAALLSAGCLGQKVTVEAYARPDAANHLSYIVREGTSRTYTPPPGRAAEDYVRTALSAKGMYEAPKGQAPDLDIVYVYEIQKKRKDHKVPDLNMDPSGGVGYTGSHTIVEITYEKTLHLIAIEKNPAKGTRARVWDISIVTEDEEPSLEKTMPLLAAAGCDRIGTNTDGPITIRLREKDEAVAFIKRGL